MGTPLNRTWLAAMALIGAAWLPGCASQDFVAQPTYQPDAALRATAPAGTAIALRVTDLRQGKGSTTADGRELLARGDQGKVYIAGAPAKHVEDALRQAFERAGFKVEANAPVVVEAEIRDFALDATHFTQGNIPGDRATTADILAMPLPGPARPTMAVAGLNVNLRKNDQRLGLNYYKRTLAKETGNDRGVINATLSKAISDTVNHIAAAAAPDVALVATLPVTDKELASRKEQLDTSEETLKAMQAQMQQRIDDLAAQLARVRAAQAQPAESPELALVRKQLADANEAAKKKDAELKTLTAALKDAGDKILALNAQVKDLSTDAEGNKDKIAALNKQIEDEKTKVKTLTEAADKLKVELAGAQDVVKKKDEQIARLNDDIKLMEMNAKLREGDLERRLKAVIKERDDLRTRESDLLKQMQALTAWSTTLVSSNVLVASSAKPPATPDAPKDPVAAPAPQPKMPQPPPDLTAKLSKVTILLQAPEVNPSTNTLDTTMPQVTVSGWIIHDQPLRPVRFSVNGQPAKNPLQTQFAANTRGIGVEKPVVPALPAGGSRAGAAEHSSEYFQFLAELKVGDNTVTIDAEDARGVRAERHFKINHRKAKGTTYIAAIGINDYATVPPLKHAVKDATDVAATLARGLDVPAGQTFTLLNTSATRAEVVTLVADKLPRLAKQDDLIVIFLAGHGMPSKNADAAGRFKKFFLPVDADQEKLDATCISMEDFAKVIKDNLHLPERVVLVVDTCFSGGIPDIRALAFERAVEPVQRGRAILTSSQASEVAVENDGHGVFTHHVLQGLAGGADANKDGRITMSELFKYVEPRVSSQTDKRQRPDLKTDAVGGDIVIAYVK